MSPFDPTDMFPRLGPAGEKIISLDGARAKNSKGTPIIPVPADAPELDFQLGRLGRPAQAWAYQDAEGRLVGYVARWDTDPKTMRPISFVEKDDGSRSWAAVGFPEPRPLYHLPDLVRRADSPILVVEGEKSADAAAALFPDMVATTAPHGAQSPAKADWSPVKGRAITIWPDNDKAGHDYTNAVTGLALAAGAESVRVVQVPSAYPDGWDLADPMPDGITQEDLRGMIDHATHAHAAPCAAGQVIRYEPRRDTKRAGASPKPDAGAPGFTCNDGGVFFRDHGKNGDAEDEWICSKLEVVAAARDAQSQGWGRMLIVTDPDGVRHEWNMPMSMLAGDGREVVAELLSLGLTIASGRGSRPKLIQYISEAPAGQRVRHVARIGWDGDVFVLPDATYGGSKGERVLLQAGASENVFCTAGSLAGWQSAVAAPCAGNSRLVLSISTAFAGPLANMIGAESGMVHLRGASSSGKTTGLRTAASVWGDPTVFIKQWRATDNGLEAIAAAHCDTLLCLDELSQVEAKAAGNIAYMLANGKGKARANRSGGSRRPPEWRILSLSNGEISLEDKLREDGRSRRVMAGQQVRVVDVPADAGRGLGVFDTIRDFASADALAIHLGAAASKDYGFAGRAFLAAITRDVDAVASEVKRRVVEFVKRAAPAASNGQVKRVAARFGLIAAAGELAIQLCILPWPAGEAVSAAEVCFNAWLEQRGGTGAAELVAALAQVARFFAQHGEARFSPWKPDSGDFTVQDLADRPTHNRAGFRREGMDGTEYFVFSEVWRTEVLAGFDASIVNKHLVAKGVLIPGGDGKPQSTHRLPGLSKAVRCYHVSSKVHGDADE